MKENCRETFRQLENYMLNDRLAAAKMVADAAIICAAELAATAPQAQKRAKLSAVVGQNAIAMTGEALAALYAARARTVEAHGEYAEVRDQIGIKPSMTGDLWKFVTGKQDGDNNLRSVA
jgi:hypothetical protein